MMLMNDAGGRAHCAAGGEFARWGRHSLCVGRSCHSLCAAVCVALQPVPSSAVQCMRRRRLGVPNAHWRNALVQ